jgi:hypothetical protein
LFLDQDLNDVRYNDIAEIEAYLKIKYGVSIDIVGGGHGCSEIIFEVRSDGKINVIVQDIAKDPEFLDFLQKRLNIRCVRSSITYSSVTIESDQPSATKVYGGAR